MPDDTPGTFSVYLLRCADGSLYTGIAIDVERRIGEHAASSRGARRLRGRGPFRLEAACEIGSRAEATRVELGIKRLPKRQKEALASDSAALCEFVAGVSDGGSPARDAAAVPAPTGMSRDRRPRRA